MLRCDAHQRAVVRAPVATTSCRIRRVVHLAADDDGWPMPAVEVLEAWLEKNAVGNNVTVESVHVVNHQVFFVIVENLFKI